MSYVATVSRIPMCDLCSQPASVDAQMKETKQWAYMCDWHFEKFGLGLGTGFGQILVLEDSTK